MVLGRQLERPVSNQAYHHTSWHVRQVSLVAPVWSSVSGCSYDVPAPWQFRHWAYSPAAPCVVIAGVVGVVVVGVVVVGVVVVGVVVVGVVVVGVVVVGVVVVGVVVVGVVVVVSQVQAASNGSKTSIAATINQAHFFMVCFTSVDIRII